MKREIAALSEGELFRLYRSSLGLYIRNDFSLWAKNRHLRHSCGGHHEMHPEDCSMVIIEAFWKRLQSRTRRGPAHTR